MFPACKSPEDLHLRNERVNIDEADSSKLAFTTFLLVEPDITCAIIVRRATHVIVLGHDILELLHD